MAVSTIVTTEGDKTANSYVTLVYADQYMEDRSNTADWRAESDDDVKNRCILKACQDMELISWIGSKYDENEESDGTDSQALAFPRGQHLNSDGNLYIPTEIKKAQCEQALWVYRLNSQTQESTERDKIASFSRGGISVTYRKEVIQADPAHKHLSQLCVLWAKPWMKSRYGEVTLIR